MSVLRDAYQILAGGTVKIAVATAEATAVVQKGKVYIITTNTDCFFRFSGTAVSSTAGAFDIFLPSGSSAILRATHATARAIRDTADGTMGISEIEIV